jgi:hypothetical protein
MRGIESSFRKRGRGDHPLIFPFAVLRPGDTAAIKR